MLTQWIETCSVRRVSLDGGLVLNNTEVVLDLLCFTLLLSISLLTLFVGEVGAGCVEIV